MCAAVVAIGLVHGAALAQTRPSAPPVAKITLTTQGITFDGAAITLEQLKIKLAELKKRNGTILYYRGPSTRDGDPPPLAVEVIQLILDNKIPVSLSATPDFSDVVEPEAPASPRK
jgi:hypothetical protein